MTSPNNFVFQNINARAELKKQAQVTRDVTDKESVISDSYGESFGDSHSPDPNEYYARYIIFSVS